jgi:hypothetical protein
VAVQALGTHLVFGPGCRNRAARAMEAGPPLSPSGGHTPGRSPFRKRAACLASSEGLPRRAPAFTAFRDGRSSKNPPQPDRCTLALVSQIRRHIATS